MPSKTVQTVLATLRLVAEQVRDDRDRADLTQTADQIEHCLDDACCPLCQEVTCDGGCPLRADRAIAMQEPLPRCPHPGSDLSADERGWFWKCRDCGDCNGPFEGQRAAHEDWHRVASEARQP
ncbi:hypothetical protein ACFW81_24165 [Streptomyces angustmyceticus]|uniref:hypothetical protein n=1 Tax=Streptomyces angustmyceticus TaxID=285578 RepID=UPI0036896293